MPLTLKESEVTAFIRDPVLAAWHFFGVELDVFQAVRLRMMWFTPEVQDDSGIFTGKTMIGWIWAQLRCILLPSPRGYDPRIVVAFWQDIGSAEMNFKPYYDKMIDKCPRFRAELKRQRGGTLGYEPVGGGFRYVYQNGNQVLVPAIGIKEDAEKMASLRAHDGLVEEQKSMEKKSDALDNQLLGRINAPCWNPDHPVWGNHRVLMGHAEDPATHPAYKRHQAAKAMIWDGDQSIAVITSSFRDWSPKFVHMRKDKQIKMDKKKMSAAKFEQRHGGLWSYGTEDWYEDTVMKKCRSARAKVMSQRDSAQAIFTAGQDTAGGRNRRSDWNALFIWRGIRIQPGERIHNTTGLFAAVDGSLWQITPAWAWQGKSRDGSQLSGIVHRGHRRFSFSRLVYDPGGGGLWVAKEFWKPQQFFDGRIQQVAGLCRPEDSGLYPQASPILVEWAKGSSDLAHAWEEPRYNSTDDGIVEAIHLKAQEMFYSQSMLWPLPFDEMPRAEREAMTAEDKKSLAYIEITLKQLERIKVKTLTRNGEDVPIISKNGFRSFLATGKKDLAYAALYGLAGMLSIINDPNGPEDSSDGSDCMAM